MTDSDEPEFPEIHYQSGHIEGCPAVEYVKDGKWEHPWHVTTNFVDPVDIDGLDGRKKSSVFVELECNVPSDCEAKVYIKADYFAQYIEAMLRERGGE